jgi:hypothetical protein
MVLNDDNVVIDFREEHEKSGPTINKKSLEQFSYKLNQLIQQFYSQREEKFDQLYKYFKESRKDLLIVAATGAVIGAMGYTATAIASKISSSLTTTSQHLNLTNPHINKALHHINLIAKNTPIRTANVVNSSIHHGARLANPAIASGAHHGAQTIAAGAHHGAHTIAAGVHHGAHTIAAGVHHGAHTIASGVHHGAHTIAAGVHHGAHTLAAGAHHGAISTVASHAAGTIGTTLIPLLTATIISASVAMICYELYRRNEKSMAKFVETNLNKSPELAAYIKEVDKNTGAIDRFRNGEYPNFKDITVITELTGRYLYGKGEESISHLNKQAQAMIASVSKYLDSTKQIER